MDHFHYRQDQLHAEDVALAAVAERFGTPCYVYSRATIEKHFRAFDSAMGTHPHLICYAVKANGNLALLALLARLGAGFDIVSRGELERVLAAGGEPEKIVFSGVGKTHDDIRRALEVGIRCFNVESIPELERIDALAGEAGTQAPISIRVNPDVDPQTHPYISTGLRENKFGIPAEQAIEVFKKAARLPHLRPVGLDCHIGSQITQLGPFEDALDRMLALADRLQRLGIVLEHLDMGGGLGIRYRDETPPLPAEAAAALLRKVADRPLEILLEPGRALVGNAGVLLTRVEYLKRSPARNFAIVDAAMNDLLRPALYSAWQDIVAVDRTTSAATETWDVVGPVCETADFLGKDRKLAIDNGHLLAVRSAGAYGFVMSSNYNGRPRAAEVMVDGGNMYLVRSRERIEDMFANETPLPPD